MIIGKTKESTIYMLLNELCLARDKHPDNHKLTVALMEEVGELAQAQLQRRPRVEIVNEAIQVACVAIRIAEEGDADFLSGTWSDVR